MAERAGSRQRIKAIAREENFDTLENRVVRSYARLAAVVAREYVARHPQAKLSSRVVRVTEFGKRCRVLESALAELGVGEAAADATPNYVLQNNANYHHVWDAWLELRRRTRELDELWRWQARSWEEFCALALVVALQSISGARLIASSPLVYREEQDQGCWLQHLNPLAVFFLAEQDMTVEVAYRRTYGAPLGDFGAPIWLRFGGIGDNSFLSRWAVWPIWHARGGLDETDLTVIPTLVPAGQRELVKGGLTIRPVAAERDPEARSGAMVACVTLGASGRQLRDGILAVRTVLVADVLRSRG